MAGGAGDDVYLVQDSSTKIIENPNAGIDSVTAYTNFALPANVEILNLQGDLITGAANDQGDMLSAFGSRDVLVSGKGNDILIDRTTDKQNIFQFDPSSGHDAVYGFTATGANHDLIRLDYSQYTSFDQLKSVMTQVGSDVRIDMDANDAILLKNVNLTDLNSADFLLPFSPSNLKMTFDDEFNSLSIDTGAPNSWNTYYRYGPANGTGSLAARTLASNGEQEIYVDPSYAGDPTKSSSPLGLNPFSVSNGVLSITASKLDAADSSKLYNYGYDSGVLTTDKTFSQTYGYFEIKADLPQEKGMFPAFWLMPTANAWPPEIDIMENVGQNYSSGGAIQPDSKDAFRTFFPQGETGMHTYGLLWTADTITWYVDGNAVGSIPTPASMHQPMYMIVNLAVGGDWAGSPDPSFSSASMKVDYVHAYSLDQVTSGGSSTTDTTTPVAPTGLADTAIHGGYVNKVSDAASQVLTGSAEANSTVAVFDGTTQLGSATASATGAWSFTLGKLADGSHNLTVTATDAAGNSSPASAALNLVVDTAAPSAPTGLTDTVVANPASDTASHILSGAAEANSTVTVFDGATQLGSATANATGAWTFSLGQLANGNHNFTATAADAAGNTGSASTALSFAVLTSPPAAPTSTGWSENNVHAGKGNEVLTGTAVVDNFYFGLTTGQDTVTDFAAHHEKDMINLSAFTSQGINPTLTQTAVGTEIYIGSGQSVMLDGVDASHLVHTSTGFVYDGT